VRQVWEYKVVRFAGRSESEQLNALGAEGWELVAVIFSKISWYYLKRPGKKRLDPFDTNAAKVKVIHRERTAPTVLQGRSHARPLETR